MTLELSEEIISAEELQILDNIQKRVLWLATNIIHHANNVRPNPDKTKVGGHQASSASLVTILTALYFHYLKAGDRVAVKPHASPAYHAIQYLLGNLPQSYLTELRAYKGLQAYPSRTKDVDPIDFSTGSVGLGAAAPTFAALVHQYAKDHFGEVTSNRFIALLGDAELDEGNVWEAVTEEALRGLDNVLWIVDLNRQSLDRVVPGIRAAQLKKLFVNSGWHVLEAKYGSKLQAIFERPNGDSLRRRIDEMSNEEYQSFLRADGATLRRQLITPEGSVNRELEQLLAGISDEELPEIYANLGGHDLPELFRVLNEADKKQGAPTVLFAYTVKGWNLPMAGDRLNHSALLSADHIEKLKPKFGIADGQEWAMFEPGSPEGELCREAAERLYPQSEKKPQKNTLDMSLVPLELNISTSAQASTQEAFGRVLQRLADMPEVSKRIVTTSPDVSISTNLAGWINKTGVYSPQPQPSYELEGARTLKWQPTPEGQHIELGISEMNLFMCLAMFGLSYELNGQQLIPIGTVYDPFVCRGLDAFIYGLYNHGRFIFAGTPSGITLSPEGGAHQSTITASIGIELPYLNFYEPGFSLETEWLLLEALRQCCDTAHGKSTYLRLSTKIIDQSLLETALKRLGKAELRRQTIAGGYRLVDWRDHAPDMDDEFVVQIAATGAIIPEAVAAAKILHAQGIPANVLNLTSQRKLYEDWQANRKNTIKQTNHPADSNHLANLILPGERHAPIVTVIDGASHSMAWLGSVFGAPVIALGVDEFGQSGSRADLYHHFDIDTDSIVNAALTAIDML
jgi:pyruvate dehydrogenase E1 component